MDLIRVDKERNIQHILCNDHKPNPAFINEFQTNSFTMKLHCIHLLEHELNGYSVDEGGAFLQFEFEIRNNSADTLELYREDFMMCYNQRVLLYPEEYFGVKKQFLDEIKIEPFASKRGCFIFLSAKQLKRIDFFYTEYYDEEHFKEYHLRYRIN